MRDHPSTIQSANAHAESRTDPNGSVHRPGRKAGRGVSLPQYAPCSDFALRWSISAESVWRLVRKGQLKGAMIGGSRRVSIEDAHRYERENEIKPVEPRRKRRANRCPVTAF